MLKLLFIITQKIKLLEMKANGSLLVWETIHHSLGGMVPLQLVKAITAFNDNLVNDGAVERSIGGTCA